MILYLWKIDFNEIKISNNRYNIYYYKNIIL